MSTEAMRKGWRRPMVGRNTAEEHRTATPLELFFDLCFVVAVGSAAGQLHHALAEDHTATGIVGYFMVFFAIWWAWMNFTWFSSAYDTDDVPYRLMTLLQMAGVLVLAAGVPRAFDKRDFLVVTIGYAIIRVSLVGQWLRAAYEDRAGRVTARRFAIGTLLVQAGWLSRLALPESWGMATFIGLAIAEIAVPVWAELAGSTQWHPGHIVERYGLFNLIVLGEVVLAATAAIQTGIDQGSSTKELVIVAICGLLIVFTMWWLYFEQPAEQLLTAGSNRTSIIWGYGHYFVFGSAAAVGAGLEVAVAYKTGHAHISETAAGASLAVPVAVYLLAVWALCARPHQRGLGELAAFPGTAVLVLLAPFTGHPFEITAGLMVVLLSIHLVCSRRR